MYPVLVIGMAFVSAAEEGRLVCFSECIRTWNHDSKLMWDYFWKDKRGHSGDVSTSIGRFCSNAKCPTMSTPCILAYLWYLNAISRVFGNLLENGKIGRLYAKETLWWRRASATGLSEWFHMWARIERGQSTSTFKSLKWEHIPPAEILGRWNAALP